MQRFRNRYLLVLDTALLAALPFLLYALRFEAFAWPLDHTRAAYAFTVVMVPLEIAILLGFGLYRRLWRYASIWELELIFAAGVLAATVAWIVGVFALPLTGLSSVRVPLSVLAMYSLFSIAIVAIPRLLLRVTGRYHFHRRATDGDRRVLICNRTLGGVKRIIEI